MMEMDQEMFNVIKKIADDLKNVLIFSDQHGFYVLYNEYELSKQNGYCLVNRIRDNQKFMFCNLKNATAWSILDWHNRIYESRRLLELDALISGINIEKKIHKRIFKKASNEIREIQRDKFVFEQIKEKEFRREIDKYIIIAKHCQQRGFENELKRTSRK